MGTFIRVGQKGIILLLKYSVVTMLIDINLCHDFEQKHSDKKNVNIPT